jgi:hypothetical protein
LQKNILSHLVAEDLLRVQQVDRKIYKIIEGSPVLQTHMFLKPRLTGPFETFPSVDTVNIPFPWALESCQSPLLGKIVVLVDDHATNTISESCPTANMVLFFKGNRHMIEEPIGARVASMLVCQPPVYVMQVSMRCCLKGKPGTKLAADRNPHFVLLKAEHGITIRHIVETIKTVRKQHQPCLSRVGYLVYKHRKDNCPEARAYQDHLKHRVTETWPEFRALHTLEQNDPTVVRWKDAFKELSPNVSYGLT